MHAVNHIFDKYENERVPDLSAGTHRDYGQRLAARGLVQHVASPLELDRLTRPLIAQTGRLNMEQDLKDLKQRAGELGTKHKMEINISIQDGMLTVAIDRNWAGENRSFKHSQRYKDLDGGVSFLERMVEEARKAP